MDDIGLVTTYLPFMNPEQQTFVRGLMSSAEDFDDFVSSLMRVVYEEERWPDLLPFIMRCCWAIGNIRNMYALVSKFNDQASVLPWYVHALSYTGQISWEAAAEKIKDSMDSFQEDWVRFEARVLLAVVMSATQSIETFDILSDLEEYIEENRQYEPYLPLIEYSKGYAFYSRHESEKSLKHFSDALRLSERFDDLFSKAISLNMLTIVTTSASESLEIAYRARDVFREFGNMLFEGVMENNIGFYKVALARYDEAIEHYLRSIEINEQVGSVSYNPYLNIAVLYGNLGQTDKALEYAERALEVAESKTIEHPAPKIEMARALILSDKTDEAYEYLEAGGELAFKSGDDRELGRYYLVRGVLEMARDDYTSAVSTLKRGLRMADNRGDPYYILQILLQLAGAEIVMLADQEEGDVTAATSIALARLEQLSQEQELSGLSAQVKLLNAEIDVIRGNKDQARARLEEALDICDTEGMTSLRSKVESRLKGLEEKKTRKSLIERFKSMIRQIAVPSGQKKETPFEVLGCIVILQESGLEVYSKYIDSRITSDPSLIAGLISAVSNFARGLREDSTGNLQSIVHQDIAVLLEHGSHATCALLVDRDTYEARVLERRFLERFEESFSDSLRRFKDGAVEPLDASPIFHSVVLKRELGN